MRSARRVALALGLLVFLASLSALSANASAGTFSVYSCHRPDGTVAPADGWTGGAGMGYAVVCGQPNELNLHVQLPAAHMPAWTIAELVWTPPVGLRPVGVTLHRWFQAPPPGGIGTPVVRINNPTDAYAAPDVLEQCHAWIGCAKRSGLVSFALQDGPLYLIAECRDGDCDPSTYGGSVDIGAYNATFTLADDHDPFVSRVAGALATMQPAYGLVDLTFEASDPGSGVYRHLVDIDGRAALASVVDSNSGRCRDALPRDDDPYQFDYAVPCPAHASGRLQVDLDKLPPGEHHVRVLVEDAASNRSTALDRVLEVVSDPARRAIDAGGIVGLSNPLGGLPGRVVNGLGGGDDARLDAYLHGPPHRRRVFGRTLSWPERHVASAVVTAGGRSAGNALVTVVERREGEPWTAGPTLRSSSDGMVSYRLSSGPSRQIRFVYFPTSESERFISSRTLSARVAARVTLHASPRRLRNGNRVHFTGRVLGDPRPVAGVLVAIQAQVGRRRWITFRLTRADGAAGVFRARYRFSNTHGSFRYRFRATVRPQAGYGYAAGLSRPIAVRVRG